MTLDTSFREATDRRARLTAYLAAAGTSVLACASADAGVVYSGPQNVSINPLSSLNLDLDLDGNGDIRLKNYVFAGGRYQGATINFAPGKIVGFNSGLSYVSALNAGADISVATVGPSFFGSMAYGANNPNAQFNNATDKYIGLSFPIGPNLFYGWVRVDVQNATGAFVVKDWAYEDSGEGIVAGAGVPEPTSLSFLAAGFAGLAMMRKRTARAG